MLNVIVAYNKKRVIGTKDNTIPWYIKEDLQHFKETTLNSSVIMGHNTWQSLPSAFKPLSNRFNIIMTRNHRYFDFEKNTKNIAACGDIYEAISLGKQESKSGEVYVIGGEQIYRLFLPVVEKVIASEIDNDFDGCFFFPELPNWNKKLLKMFKDFRVFEYIKLN